MTWCLLQAGHVRKRVLRMALGYVPSNRLTSLYFHMFLHFSLLLFLSSTLSLTTFHQALLKKETSFLVRHSLSPILHYFPHVAWPELSSQGRMCGLHAHHSICQLCMLNYLKTIIHWQASVSYSTFKDKFELMNPSHMLTLFCSSIHYRATFDVHSTSSL